MSRKMTGIVKTFDCKSGKGLITLRWTQRCSGHISACRQHETEALIPGIRVEFCRINGLRTYRRQRLSFIIRHPAFFRKI
ncbi:cold shock domain-containing protein [Salmonella enterica subsp. enterica serovar Infantis]|nr:cold shock domain-containing protein [Salmonella enterica subsp. enterica serovar Infantis]